jgi:hypothetical protein
MHDHSLLPYLSGFGSGFSLAFTQSAAAPDTASPQRFPFEIISEAGPLTRILCGSIVSDAGALVKPVFMLLSRDEYALPGGGIAPLANPDIDAAWKAFFQAKLLAGRIITLAAQLDESGRLHAFRPLFACTHTRRFFHPTCPQCGAGLDLARDDALLADAGLKQYSRSCRRYLACPVCSLEPGTREFYAFRPEGTDPETVKGPAELIAALSRAAGGSPCGDCPERGPCHDAGQADKRLASIAFYPFHLALYEAASMNAADFLALVSGASPRELERSLAASGERARARQVAEVSARCPAPLLFPADDRQFLEVLYLKLSFLGEVARGVLSGTEHTTHPRFGPGLDKMWIRIPDQAGLLPAFWSADLAFTDMDLQIPEVLPVPGKVYAAHVMGLLWFQALLANRLQDTRTVNQALARALQEKRVDPADPVLNARNLFWEPREAPSRWRGLWAQTMDLGAELLLKAGEAQGFPEAFAQAHRVLMDTIREEMLARSGVAEPPREQGKEDRAGADGDAAIGEALGRIRARWEQEAALVPAEVPPGPSATALPAAPEEEDFRTETVIMRHAPESARPEPEGDLDRTMVTGAAPASAGTAPEPPREEDLSQTVVMGARLSTQVTPPEQDSAQTLILGAGAAPAQKPAQPDLDATVVMGAKPGPAAPPVQQGPWPKNSSAEELEETVIMKPGSRKKE